MNKSDLSKCIKALRNGDVIVYPTDTLYALGADIFNNDAVKKIFKLKKRPSNNPLPIAISNVNEIEKIAILNNKAKRIAEQFLPGSLTLVLNKKSSNLKTVTADLNKIAVRIPDNDVALDLLSQSGPLTVTSANIHGKKTPYVINEIKMQFNKDVAVYLDYGRLDGEASTIVDLTSEKPIILRKGFITEKEILDAI
jgi:L-threonylcarbamoyladenylate synthase